MNREALMAWLRRPQSAAVAGLIFAGILGTVVVLLHNAAPETMATAARWGEGVDRRGGVSLALGLIPFAGIAFLWFIGVIRTHLGSLEDRFFETVFLGSGLLFVALLFAGAATLKATLMLEDAGVNLSPETRGFAWSLASALLAQFGTRMAAVFTVSVATAGIRSGALPRWLGLVGYAAGLLLLLTPPLPNVLQLLFPAWILVLSVQVLVGRRARAPLEG